MLTEMQNTYSLLLKNNRFDAIIIHYLFKQNADSLTLINTEELFKQLDFPQLRHKKAKTGKNSLFHYSESE